VSPSVPSYIMNLTTNPIVMFFISLGIVVGLIGAVGTAVVYATRMIFMASFDRLVPEWFARINMRIGGPVNSVVPLIIAAGLINILFSFFPGFYSVVTSAASLTYIALFIPTALAAVVLPYKYKAIYASSPISKYRIFGVPLVTITGGWLLVVTSAIFVTGWVVPAIGGFLIGRLVVAGFLIGPALWYFVRKWYLGRREIDLSLAYKEIPPE
jgi:APA family basic amino acid/polyamine antiporter